MEQFLLVGIVSLLGSLLTFFSGFGLGTILLPVMALFFPLPVAIASTAIVHLCNNVFKFFLVRKKLNVSVLIQFGIPSALASFAGSMLLLKMQDFSILFEYSLWGKLYSVTWLNLIMGLLILFFSLLEVLPLLQKLDFSKLNPVFGGLISGFFGGLSGHQGALRSAFLIRYNLSKEEFLSTGITLALLVDLVRIPNYLNNSSIEFYTIHFQTLITAIIFALIGAVIGNKIFKKVTLNYIRAFVSLFLFFFSLLICTGILNR